MGKPVIRSDKNSTSRPGIFSLLKPYGGIVILLIIMAFFMLFKLDSLAGLILGVIAGFILKQPKELYNWLLLGFMAGAVFTVELTPAYTVFVFLVIYAFFYASEMSIPFVLKRKKFFKTLIFEQAALVAVGLASFVFVGISGPVVAGNLFFFAVGILATLLIKEIKNF